MRYVTLGEGKQKKKKGVKMRKSTPHSCPEETAIRYIEYKQIFPPLAPNLRPNVTVVTV